jgi:hypothetical protein
VGEGIEVKGWKRPSKTSRSKDHTNNYDMWAVELLAHILPENDREEWLGDLKEARRSLLCNGWSIWAVTPITIARACLLVWSLLRIKYQDLGLGAGRTTDRGSLEGFPEIVELIERIAPFKSTVVVTGDWDSGKESVARAIHAKGNRRNKPFVALNCGALPPPLIARQLFGNRLSEGCLERANHGSLFLDHVDKLSFDLQAELLRVLVAEEFLPGAGNQSIQLDIRLIVASDRGLADAVQQGRFREDLYYRINVSEIMLPPLNLRKA